MANKKPEKRAAPKKPVKKAVQPEITPDGKAAVHRPARKKSPEIKAAVRVTKKNIKAVKPTAKLPAAQPELPAETRQESLVADPAPTPVQFESPCIADSQQTAAAACPPQYARQVTHDEIRHLAYLKWEAAGRPDGDGGHFWWEAERELLQR